MIEIRGYRESDLDKVNVILQEAFNETKVNFKNNNFKELVACVDGEVAGYLLLTRILNPIKRKYYYLVDYVCVSSKYRRLGLGRKLLEEVYKIARENKAIYIQLTSSRYREAAHKLYLNCGYVKRDSDIFRKDIV